MSNLMPRPLGPPGSPAGIVSARPSRRVSREIERAVEEQYARGVTEAAAAQADAYASAAVVQSAAFVANLGYTAIGMLADEEARIAARSPHAIPHLEAALNALSGVVAREIAKQGWSS